MVVVKLLVLWECEVLEVELCEIILNSTKLRPLITLLYEGVQTLSWFRPLHTVRCMHNSTYIRMDEES